MKKRITLFAIGLVMAVAVLFTAGFLRITYAGCQSCSGKCNRAKNACLATARKMSEAAQCNKSYQGCISSCK